jgi:glycosyltransferase 2 family protein
VIAVLETWERSQGFPIPSVWAFAWAGLLVLGGLVLLAKGWVRLLPRPSSRGIAGSFYASQVGRYIPGVVWQPAAQIALATRAGATLPQASTAFAVHAVVQAAAGGTVGATFLAVGWGLPLGIRLLALSTLLPVALLYRAALGWAVAMLGRLFGRTFPRALIPSQGAILISYGWTVATVAANGLAFWILLSSVDGGVPVSVAVPAFALAWTVGFLVVVFPSGIGVREATLILLIGTASGTTPLIAASLAHRLVIIVAEGVMITWTGFWSVRRRLAAAEVKPTVVPDTER